MFRGYLHLPLAEAGANSDSNERRDDEEAKTQGTTTSYDTVVAIKRVSLTTRLLATLPEDPNFWKRF